jgi:hypothetical protein
MWYKKRPIPVTAKQWFKDGDHPKVIGLCKLHMVAGPDEVPVRYVIQTAEGSMAVTPGCWIVGPGHSGEYWPVRDDIFRATYEPCDPPEIK